MNYTDDDEVFLFGVETPDYSWPWQEREGLRKKKREREHLQKNRRS
jgi:hypothetical protein